MPNSPKSSMNAGGTFSPRTTVTPRPVTAPASTSQPPTTERTLARTIAAPKPMLPRNQATAVTIQNGASGSDVGSALGVSRLVATAKTKTATSATAPTADIHADARPSCPVATRVRFSNPRTAAPRSVTTRKKANQAPEFGSNATTTTRIATIAPPAIPREPPAPPWGGGPAASAASTSLRGRYGPKTTPTNVAPGRSSGPLTSVIAFSPIHFAMSAGGT